MNRRVFLKSIGVLSLGMTSPLSAWSTPKQPNILFIFSDDHSLQTLGAYKSRMQEFIKKHNITPNIDKIAAEGVEGVNEAAHSIEDLRSAGEYLIRTAEYTTTLPVWLLIAMDLEHIDDPDVRAIAEALRAQTLYPRVERYVVDPLA